MVLDPDAEGELSEAPEVEVEMILLEYGLEFDRAGKLSFRILKQKNRVLNSFASKQSWVVTPQGFV